MAAANLRERALRLLAQRDHSHAELARKLLAHGSQEEVAETLVRMGELGFLNDRRFAAAWVRTKAGRFGTARLRYDLAQRGISRDIIDEVLQTEETEPELDRAREIWRTRYGHPPADPREWARQARFLQSRGFASSVIRSLLKEDVHEPA